MSQRWDVLTVKERGEGQKAWFTKIGSAWAKDNGNISIMLDALPMDGKLVLMPPRENDRAPGEQGQFRSEGRKPGPGVASAGGGRPQSNQQRYSKPRPQAPAAPAADAEPDFNPGSDEDLPF